MTGSVSSLFPLLFLFFFSSVILFGCVFCCIDRRECLFFLFLLFAFCCFSFFSLSHDGN